MKFLSEKLKQLSRAMEFANIDTYTEFNRLLESHERPAPVAAAPIARRKIAAERPTASARGYGQIIDFSAFAHRVALKHAAGQH